MHLATIIFMYLVWGAVMAVFVLRMLQATKLVAPWRKHFQAKYPDYNALYVLADRKINQTIFALLSSLPVVLVALWVIGRVF